MAELQQTTQSKYRKKKKPEQQPSIDPNEVRIKGNQGHVKRYVDYACSLLEGKRVTEKPDKEDNQDKEKDEAEENAAEPEEPQKFDSIVLKATGRAINKAVTTAEVVKRRVAGLHQVTSLETLEITDVWEPLEEGLKEVETKRRVASITITLSRDESLVDKNAAGYQVPIANDAIKPFGSTYGARPSPARRRRGRGGKPRGGPRRGGGGRYGGGGRRGGGGGGGGYGGGRRRNDRDDRDRGYGGGRRGGRRGGYGGDRDRGDRDRGYGGRGGGRYGGGRRGGGGYGGGGYGGQRSSGYGGGRRERY